MNQTQPAHGKAVASLVCGIVGIVLWFFGYSAIVSIILAIVGKVLASGAKKEGNTEGIRKAGSILCVITLIGGIIALIVACVIVGGIIAIGLS